MLIKRKIKIYQFQELEIDRIEKKNIGTSNCMNSSEKQQWRWFIIHLFMPMDKDNRNKSIRKTRNKRYFYWKFMKISWITKIIFFSNFDTVYWQFDRGLHILNGFLYYAQRKHPVCWMHNKTATKNCCLSIINTSKGITENVRTFHCQNSDSTVTHESTTTDI